MLPSASGSTPASSASARQRPLSSRASALASPLTYLSNHAAVYQATMSIPRTVAPKNWLGMWENSWWVPPRMTSSPVSTPALEYASDPWLLPSGSGWLVLGWRKRPESADMPSAGLVIAGVARGAEPDGHGAVPALGDERLSQATIALT